jgi:hypothetical protein
MKQTKWTRCLKCLFPLKSVPVKYGVKAIVLCPHCRHGNTVPLEEKPEKSG